MGLFRADGAGVARFGLRILKEQPVPAGRRTNLTARTGGDEANNIFVELFEISARI